MQPFRTFLSLKTRNIWQQPTNYYGGQQVNQVIADVAANVRTGWQFPPFFEWMRSEWNDVATPYFTNGEGDLKTVFDNWQKSSIDYGNEQGFTVE